LGDWLLRLLLLLVIGYVWLIVALFYVVVVVELRCFTLLFVVLVVGLPFGFLRCSVVVCCYVTFTLPVVVFVVTLLVYVVAPLHC